MNHSQLQMELEIELEKLGEWDPDKVLVQGFQPHEYEEGPIPLTLCLLSDSQRFFRIMVKPLFNACGVLPKELEDLGNDLGMLHHAFLRLRVTPGLQATASKWHLHIWRTWIELVEEFKGEIDGLNDQSKGIVPALKRIRCVIESFNNSHVHLFVLLEQLRVLRWLGRSEGATVLENCILSSMRGFALLLYPFSIDGALNDSKIVGENDPQQNLKIRLQNATSWLRNFREAANFHLSVHSRWLNSVFGHLDKLKKEQQMDVIVDLLKTDKQRIDFETWFRLQGKAPSFKFFGVGKVSFSRLTKEKLLVLSKLHGLDYRLPEIGGSLYDDPHVCPEKCNLGNQMEAFLHEEEPSANEEEVSFVLLGHAQAGKSTFVHKVVSGEFKDGLERTPSQGSETVLRVQTKCRGKSVKLIIRDTDGSRFRGDFREFDGWVRKSDVLLMMGDVMSESQGQDMDGTGALYKKRCSKLSKLYLNVATMIDKVPNSEKTKREREGLKKFWDLVEKEDRDGFDAISSKTGENVFRLLFVAVNVATQGSVELFSLDVSAVKTSI